MRRLRGHGDRQWGCCSRVGLIVTRMGTRIDGRLADWLLRRIAAALVAAPPLEAGVQKRAYPAVQHASHVGSLHASAVVLHQLGAGDDKRGEKGSRVWVTAARGGTCLVWVQNIAADLDRREERTWMRITLSRMRAPLLSPRTCSPHALAPSAAVACCLASARAAASTAASLARSRAMAASRLPCCDRLLWQDATVPVGRYVTRTALSVVFTCWR